MAVVILKDGSRREYPQPVTPLQVAEDLSKRLAKEAVVAKVNGALWDINRVMPAEAELELLDFDNPQARDVYRHSTSHLMAQAVQELYPDVRLAIGPAIEDGFYYDFDLKEPLTPEDMQKIQGRMEELVKEDLEIQRQVLSREEALDLFRKMGEDYKVELIEDLPEDAEISCYRQG
ncbi:MAG TPA: threonine--tRNA ligase, partial [Firmicutes bacterium]|nr:threonine--tRNA ligase [Bacillota bacterium]